MSSRSVSIIDVGTPSSKFQSRDGWETAEVRFHGFAGLPSSGIDEYTRSSVFTCVGSQWCLEIYPGGDAHSMPGFVPLYLRNMTDRNIDVRFGFNVKDVDWQNNDESCVYGWKEFFPRGDEDDYDYHGDENFASRTTILNSLVGGALVVEIFMKLVDPTKKTQRLSFIPENPACNNFVQKLFMDENSSDVIFEVHQPQSGSINAKKKAKTSPATFYAHKLILMKCAPQLAELCLTNEGNASSASSPVVIPDVTPEIFHFLMLYVYGNKIPQADLNSNAKEIIDAADKYGMSNLKLEAEASFVKETKINLENIMDLLLYSDAKNCALLKEAVMDYIVENKVEVLEKISFKDAPAGPTMITDIIAAFARGDKPNGNDARNNDQLSTMRISELRRKAHGKGLDVDGSREALIAALEEHS